MDEVLEKILANLEAGARGELVREVRERCAGKSAVEKWLNYSWLREMLGPTELGRRSNYDGDAVFFKAAGFPDDLAENGDVMRSFWTPYRKAVSGLGAPWAKRRWYRNLESLDLLLKMIDTPEMRELNEKFEEFASSYWTRGNLLLLPSHRLDDSGKVGRGRMNNDRFGCGEDDIATGLRECFPGGKLAKYFAESEENVWKWVEAEHLESLFEGKKLKRDSLSFEETVELIKVRNGCNFKNEVLVF